MDDEHTEGKGIRELPRTDDDGHDFGWNTAADEPVDEGFECCRNQGTAFCDHGPGAGY